MVWVACATATLCLWQALIVEQATQTELIRRLSASSGADVGRLGRAQWPIPQAALGAGFALGTLLAAAVHLAQTARRRAEEVGRVNAELNAQIAERRRAEEGALPER